MHQTIKSMSLSYEERGAGVPIINLHGWPAEHGQMMAMMEPLFERGSGLASDLLPSSRHG